MEVTVEPDRESFQRVIAAIKEDQDGKELVRDLRKGFKAALEPAAAEARNNILTMRSAGLPEFETSLRTAIASKVTVDVSLSAKSPRVGIKARRKDMPRGFTNAPKRLNSAKGWRHPLFGDRTKWVQQIGAPGWFDRPMAGRRDQYLEAATKALQAVADRISRKA